jgi:hypothetical protein
MRKNFAYHSITIENSAKLQRRANSVAHQGW